MIKGHVCIDLKNVETGEKQRIEHDNLVTNAVAEILPYQFGRFANDYYSYGHNDFANSYIFPISTKLLGGIMLFDGKLTEDASHFYFPSEAHLIGFAGQSLDSSHNFMGSVNSLESGSNDRGYTAVWDFNTSQCNGSIAALALTHARISNGLFTSAQIRGYDRIGYRFDDKEQIEYYTSSSKIKKRRVPNIRFKVNDTLWNVSGDKEIADATSFTDETIKAIFENIGKAPSGWGPYLNYGTGSYGYYATFETLGKWDWGYDGKIYLSVHETNSPTNTFYILPLNASDHSFDLNDLITVTFESKVDVRNDKRCVSNGNFYIISYDNAREIIRVNLSNPVDQHTYTLDNPAELISALPYGGAKVYYSGNYNANKACDILYPDGETRSFADKGQGAYSMWGCGGYLGTICNLGTAIEKTSAQTMKITYTLTDAEETATETTSSEETAS